MTYVAPNPSDEYVFTALRSFLLDQAVPSMTEVIQSNDDRVSPPPVPYVVMNAVSKTRISTNISSVSTSIIGSHTVTSLTLMKPTRYNFQLDVVGDLAADWAEVISMLWFGGTASEFLAAYGIAPLYNDDPKYAPWINDSNQWEQRWIVRLCLQFNPALIIPVGSFASAEVGVVDVQTFPLI